MSSCLSHIVWCGRARSHSQRRHKEPRPKFFLKKKEGSGAKIGNSASPLVLWVFFLRQEAQQPMGSTNDQCPCHLLLARGSTAWPNTNPGANPFPFRLLLCGLASLGPTSVALDFFFAIDNVSDPPQIAIGPKHHCSQFFFASTLKSTKKTRKKSAPDALVLSRQWEKKKKVTRSRRETFLHIGNQRRQRLQATHTLDANDVDPMKGLEKKPMRFL
nr:hypothetical protein [Pandoravirus massiliensis]